MYIESHTHTPGHEPFDVEFEVLQDASGDGDKRAAHAGYDSPATDVGGATWLRGPCSLLNELTVEFISQGSEVMTCLQKALNYWDGIGHTLKLLKCAKKLQRLSLQSAVAPPPFS